MIGVPTAEYARRADFYDYFNMLQKPNLTPVVFAHGQSPARGRNLIIRQALELNCSHILFLDDDVAFKPDMLMKLLSHDVDIVTGLYLMRNYPHKPIIFSVADADGRCINHYPKDSESGLIEVVACGLGACLIKSEIFRKLEEPWIRLGELELDHWCDDIGFFRRVRMAGFKIHCDLDVTVGHMASATIWPERVDGQWRVTYHTNGIGSVQFPAIRPSDETFNEAVKELVGVGNGVK